MKYEDQKIRQKAIFKQKNRRLPGRLHNLINLAWFFTRMTGRFFSNRPDKQNPS